MEQGKEQIENTQPKRLNGKYKQGNYWKIYQPEKHKTEEEISLRMQISVQKLVASNQTIEQVVQFRFLETNISRDRYLREGT